jgi:hypothetical protein
MAYQLEPVLFSSATPLEFIDGLHSIAVVVATPLQVIPGTASDRCIRNISC